MVNSLFKKKKVRSSISAFSPVVYEPAHLRLRDLTVVRPQLSAAIFCISGGHFSVLHGLHSSGLKVSKGKKAMCINNSSGLKTYSLQLGIYERMKKHPTTVIKEIHFFFLNNGKMEGWENKGGGWYLSKFAISHQTVKKHFPSRSNYMLSFRVKQSKPKVKDQVKIFT